MNNFEISTPKLQGRGGVCPLPLPKYYPGYSQEFVADALSFLDSEKGMTVLDPWSGFGTTGWIAQSLQFKSYLVDLNPAMAVLSASMDVTLLSQINQKEIKNLISLIINREKIVKLSFVPSWAPPKLTASVVGALQALSESGLISKTGIVSAPHAFLTSVLFSIFRDHVTVSRLANPTYVKLDTSNVIYSDLHSKAFYIQFEQRALEFIESLSSYSSNIKTVPMKVYNRDSRSLNLSASSIDRVITSPPYCTRIDYAKMTSVELTLMELAGISNFDLTRRQLMGAPTVPKTLTEVNQEWGRTCSQVLDKVWKHKSTGSKSYYHKNLSQYFNDAFLSLNEISHCLKSDGSGLIVVQNSYYKEHEIKLSKIYVEMLTNLGFDSRIVAKHEVKSNMVYCNPGTRQYAASKRSYTEDVVMFKKISNDRRH
jgi:hypothetical protein